MRQLLVEFERVADSPPWDNGVFWNVDSAFAYSLGDSLYCDLDIWKPQKNR
ncbi:MAG: hypothetical protein M2R45_03748 [Verrucomicrobia subdivision 3 bacterium]|nr:hypothetical protein [Limisphaerales bacterium]MCS1416928.1 hypothetical protein [Limisphaerales bacterium]